MFLVRLAGAAAGAGATRRPGARAFASRFVDSVVLHAEGGNGGDGCMSFEGRAANKESPDGGHGGKGGDIILEARSGFRDLGHINSFHVKAKDGWNGSGQGKSGRKGKNTIILVPVGTAVYKAPLSHKQIKARMEQAALDAELNQGNEDEDEDGYDDDEEDGYDEFEDQEEGLARVDQEAKTATSVKLYKQKKQRLLADLDEEGATFTIARGGLPGKGNIMQSTMTYDFYIHLKPEDRSGREGSSTKVELRLKLIADCCFVGYPNAGKSSLLGSLTTSRPPVAAYPFTTLHPFIGVLRYSDEREIRLADLPGLVDGAAENRGMGHKFLRHTERTKVLIFVLDGAPESHERAEFHSASTDFRNLQAEMESYQRNLTKDRPKIVVVTKVDRPDAQERFEQQRAEIRQQIMDEDPDGAEPLIFAVSARDGTGLGELSSCIRHVVEMVELQEQELALPKEEKLEIFSPLPRVERGLAQRRPLLHRIKWREATHGDVKVWRTNRKSDRNMKRMKPLPPDFVDRNKLT